MKKLELILVIVAFTASGYNNHKASLQHQDVTMYSANYTAQPHVYHFINGDVSEEFTAEDLRDQVLYELFQNARQLNSQFPIRVDEYTTLISAELVGMTIHYNYVVDLDSEELTEEEIEEMCDEIKERNKKNLRFLLNHYKDKMPVDEWIELYKELGVKYNYNYFDKNKLAFAKIEIDFSEL